MSNIVGITGEICILDPLPTSLVLCFHHYADDLQLYCHFDLTATPLSATLRRMEDCLDVVNMWMASNYMCMKNNETEYLPVIPKTAAATALVDGSVYV